MSAFITLGKKKTIETIFLFGKKYLCIHVMFKMRCVMYVLCTSPMYPLSTHNHNLYTFAQSTRCLYIHSYFMSRMVVVFFLYMCMCQISFARKQWNNWHVSSNWLDVCFSECACMCARARAYVNVILSLLFIARENKSPWRKWIECVLPERCCELSVNVRGTVLIRSYYWCLLYEFEVCLLLAATWGHGEDGLKLKTSNGRLKKKKKKK